jgi:DNA-binding NarL/FixJ family response regulator
MQAGADVVLGDAADNSEPAIALIRTLREQDEDIKVIVLTLRMEGDWLERAFEAGANGAMSKGDPSRGAGDPCARGRQRTHRSFAGLYSVRR